MLDWNLVATVHVGDYPKARQLLQRYGQVEHTVYYNVIVARVDNVDVFLETFSTDTALEPWLLGCLHHLRPARATFIYQSPAEFEQKAQQCAARWLERIAGGQFHVRMHRRGFKGRLSSQHEEQFLDHDLLERVRAMGQSARVSFDEPDHVIAVDTVGQRAGLALWTRADLRRYPFLGLD